MNGTVGRKIMAIAATATALVFLNFMPLQRAKAQELTVQATGTTYQNGKVNRVALGFAASKPLTEKMQVGFDFSISSSPKEDIVESYQAWFSYCISDKILVTPYFWKDRFYAVDPYAAGAVVSIGRLNIIAEWEAPKTNNDPTVWAEGISYTFNIGCATVTQKLIFAQYLGHVFDAVGLEVKGSYQMGQWMPFLKVKMMDDIAFGEISTNAQVGLNLKL